MEERGRRSEAQVLRRQADESIDDYWLRCRRAVEEAKQRHPSARGQEGDVRSAASGG